jgi:hypothetical protein
MLLIQKQKGLVEAQHPTNPFSFASGTRALYPGCIYENN